MPLPEIDPMLVVTDPPAMAAFNKQLIGEYRANGGRISGQLAGAPVLLLTTTGAKTGRPRTTPLSYVPHPHGCVVAASKAGAPTHPDWFHNLLADPTATVEVGREQIRVRAIVTHGDDRSSLYAQLSTAWPMMDDYQAATTREIPVVVLERAGLDPGFGRSGGVGRSVGFQP
jgi:deazaflavin-dependent oxidoreductase (nitroreductase family)